MSNIYLSRDASPLLKEYLKDARHRVTELSPLPNLEPALACHPDVRMCRLGKTVFFGDTNRLGRGYPRDAVYNACSTGKFFIHNLKYTDPELLDAARVLGQRAVHVPQGYAKCSCVAVDADSVITADRGIEKAASAAGMNVLLVSPGQVLLRGYPYGFIGGASGRVENAVIFNGDLSSHSDFEAVRDFIKSRGLELIYFPQYPLTDIGSVIEEEQTQERTR